MQTMNYYWSVKTLEEAEPDERAERKLLFLLSLNRFHSTSVRYAIYVLWFSASSASNCHSFYLIRFACTMYVLLDLFPSVGALGNLADCKSSLLLLVVLQN